ncbi:MAG: transporter substrate-binding domain-containing protein, partial [Anaerolineales bacterium]|nr:transporter substrate-binding domain-containing protein [Anaerolineales bacterium]
MKKNTILSLGLMLLLLLLVACGGAAEAPTEPEAEPTTAPAETETETETEPVAEATEAPVAETEEEMGEMMMDLEGREVRIAVENAYNPFSFIDAESGEAIGYDYDIFNEICARANCTPVFVETSWDAMVAIMGGSGDFDTFDIGADGITITEERA